MNQRGFTLVELLIVIGVIITLMAIGAGVAPLVMKRSRIQSTLATVTALAASIETDGRVRFAIDDPALRAQQVERSVPAWDVNADGWVDGDPTILNAAHPDPAGSGTEFTAAQRTDIIDRLAGVVASGPYRGAVRGLADLTIASDQLDAGGRPVDAWGVPLRILHRGAAAAPSGAKAASRHFIGIYSRGPDGIDAQGEGDDVRSW